MNPKVTSRKKVAREIHGGLGPGMTHTKKTGMLVLLLKGVNCRVWSHLGCLGRKVTITAHSHRLELCIIKEIYKKCRETDNVVLIIIII